MVRLVLTIFVNIPKAIRNLNGKTKPISCGRKVGTRQTAPSENCMSSSSYAWTLLVTHGARQIGKENDFEFEELNVNYFLRHGVSRPIGFRKILLAFSNCVIMQKISSFLL